MAYKQLPLIKNFKAKVSFLGKIFSKYELSSDDIKLLIKIHNKDFKTTKVIHHGKCHGCITPDLNIDNCKACYCYAGEKGTETMRNWRNGIDEYRTVKLHEVYKKLTVQMNKEFDFLIKNSNIKETHPEEFI